MRTSPAIFVTTPTSPINEKIGEEPNEDAASRPPTPNPSTIVRSAGPSPTASRMSFLNVDSDAHRRPPSGRGGSIAAIRRHTVMLAMAMRRFSRNDATSSSSSLRNRVTLEEFEKLVHEFNHIVAAYRQILQSVGTYSESGHTRKELSSCRRQCLRICESAKNCIMPLLKDDTKEEPDFDQTSDLAKHASRQFIGCLNMFVGEMKRTQSLLQALPQPGSASLLAQTTSCPDSVTDATSYCGSFLDLKGDDELEALSKDLKEAEEMLEALENAITVHFAIEPHRPAETLYPAPKMKKNGRQYSKFCVYFKTNYA